MEVSVPTKLTLDDLLAEMQAQASGEGDGWTAEDLADRTGMSLSWVHKELRRYRKERRLEHTGSRPSTRTDGRASKTPVYRLKKQGE